LQHLTNWIDLVFQQRTLLLMGHAQRRDDLNLGLGWLYYALGRTLRPATAVVIGSWRGFVPLVLARALADNCEGGQVHFIDPGLVDDFWRDAQKVREYFAGFGATNIEHHLATTQKFIGSVGYRQLSEVGIVFIDGYHTAEQARFDFDAFSQKLAPNGVMLLHDSIDRKISSIYGAGREYLHTVADFVTELKQQSQWQLMDLPHGDGLSIVRRAIGAAAGRRLAA